MPIKKLLTVIYLSIFCLISKNVIAEDKPIFNLGTGSTDGEYYALGISIKNILQKNNISINVIPTKGSIDNIKKLDSGTIDIAIVQNDIAFFYTFGLEPFKTPSDKLRALIPLYTEPIFILSNDNAIQTLQNLTRKKVNIGEKDSGLNADAKLFLETNDLLDIIETKEEPDNTLNELFIDHKIDAAFINYINKNLLESLKQNKLFPISLSHKEISDLNSTYPYFTEFSTNINDHTINTFAVRALLITNKKLPKNVAYEITKTLYEKYNNLNFPNKDANINNLKISEIPIIKWHKGSEAYYLENKLIHSNALLVIIWATLFLTIILLLGLLILNILIFKSKTLIGHNIRRNKKFFNTINKLNTLVKTYQTIFFIIILFTLFLSDLLLIKYFDHTWAIRHNKVSPFDNISLTQNIIWLFVFSGSTYNDNIFPISPTGKILATLIPIISVSTLVTSIGVLATKTIKKMLKESRGETSKTFKNHIIICGYNRSTDNLILDLTNEQLPNIKSVLLLAPLGDNPNIPAEIKNSKHFGYINGFSSDKYDLNKAMLADAETAIIISDEPNTNNDSDTILKILTIDRHFKNLNNSKPHKAIHIVAELSQLKNKSLAEDAGAHEIICLSGFKSKLLAQSILNPGVNQILEEILTFNENNEVYNIYITKEHTGIINKTFDEALITLRKHEILLLSILRGMNSSDTSSLTGAPDAKLRKVITNPISKAENDYKIKEKDTLIVLAKEGKHIKYTENILKFK